MGHNNRPTSLSLSSSSPARPISSSPSPLHRQSQSPFRYIQLDQQPDDMTEKSTPLADLVENSQRQMSPGPSASQQHRRSPSRCLASPSQHLTAHPRPVSSPNRQCSPFLRQPSQPLRPFSQTSSTYARPRGLRITNLLRPWVPLILYALTSLAFVAAIAFYRDEVFSRLDELAHWLQSDKQTGYTTLFLLIFLTTFPPIPLYSTLITLSGYAFGPWTGAIISYFAALSGALTVFLISRTFFRDCISQWLSSTRTIKRVVCAVEKRPKLLFLIRLAPYPYNVMNCLLAAAPTLTLRTYTLCTGLSLLKVIVHTSMGASIASFKDYHSADPNNSAEPHEHSAAELWTAFGIVLCIAILVYISIVARKAVDHELDDESIPTCDSEETVGFLQEVHDLESGREQPMAESPFRNPIPYRPSMER